MSAGRSLSAGRSMRAGRLPWSTSSVRVRLLTGLLGLLVIGLVASILASVLLLQGFLEDRYRSGLQVTAARMRAVLAEGPQTVDSEQLSVLLGPPMGIVVVGTDGGVAETSGVGQADPVALIRAMSSRPTDTVVWYDGGEGIDDLLAVRLPSPGLSMKDSDSPTLVHASAVILVTDTEIDHATVRALIVHLIEIVAGTLVLLGLLGALVLRVGMDPLRRMAVAADTIAAGSLTDRLPTRGRRTETDVLAHAVNQAFDAQAHAEATARTFAADASHELRTPLATISGWLDLYHQGSLAGPDVDRAIEHIDAEVGRMRLIVDELGLLARLDAGRPLDQAKLDLTALAAGVVDDAQIIHPDRTITFTGPAPVAAIGDEPRLQQVLRNLVGNAVQHTPAWTAVHVLVETAGDQAVVKVSDDGPGIAPEHLPQVFDRFWRAEASRSRAFGGSGLGLAIVQAIVQAHHGTVTVTSTLGVGTTVTVSLPPGR